MNRMPFEPIRIYFSDLRNSAGVRQAIARVFTDWTKGVIQAVHRLVLSLPDFPCIPAYLIGQYTSIFTICDWFDVFAVSASCWVCSGYNLSIKTMIVYLFVIDVLVLFRLYLTAVYHKYYKRLRKEKICFEQQRWTLIYDANTDLRWFGV